MSDQYTPTTEVVKDAACFPRERLGEPRPIPRAAFDRWLASVKAEAWDEGVAAQSAMYHEEPDAEPNPYREQGTK